MFPLLLQKLLLRRRLLHPPMSLLCPLDQHGGLHVLVEAEGQERSQRSLRLRLRLNRGQSSLGQHGNVSEFCRDSY